MRERVSLLGGRFEIAAGNPGTVVKVAFPLAGVGASNGQADLASNHLGDCF
jgi:signal transduction histidine kinase